MPEPVARGALALAALLLALGCAGHAAPGMGASEPAAAAPETSEEPAAARVFAARGDDEAPSEDELRIAAIERAVNDTREAQHECWAFAAASDFRVRGRIVLRLTFGQGDTAGVEVVSDGPGSARLTGCLTELYSLYRWPPVFEPGQAIELPFVFGAPRGQHTIFARHVEPVSLEDGKLRVSVLLHEQNSGNGAASVSLLSLRDGMEVPLHRHSSAEILYVHRGEGLVYGLDGRERGVRVAAGHGIYIPAGVAHGFVHRGAEPVSLVQVYAPAGPERRFTGGPTVGTSPVSAAEARRPPRQVARPSVTSRPARYAIAGGTAAVDLYFDEAITGDGTAYMGRFTAQPGARVPPHRHERESEILLVLEGSGVMTVAGEAYAIEPMTAVQVPANLEHAFEVTSQEPVVALQFYVPAGPEQRFKKAP